MKECVWQSRYFRFRHLGSQLWQPSAAKGTSPHASPNAPLNVRDLVLVFIRLSLDPLSEHRHPLLSVHIVIHADPGIQSTREQAVERRRQLGVDLFQQLQGWAENHKATAVRIDGEIQAASVGVLFVLVGALVEITAERNVDLEPSANRVSSMGCNPALDRSQHIGSRITMG